MGTPAEGGSRKGRPKAPQVFVIGGPNGAGKSTIAEIFIGEHLGLGEFVNADVIARGLAGFDPDAAAIQAGRIMLTRLRELAAQRVDFSFETTLASRTFARWLTELRASGYQVNIVYSWLRSPELAVARVRRRIRRGGHAVPEETIIRRYQRSISNLFELYLPIADRWRVYDNSGSSPRVVATAHPPGAVEVFVPDTWARIKEIADASRDQG
jgi:predicted ABC-type ATPase